MKGHQAIFSGSGGQGLMFIGKLLAKLAIDDYPNITFFPSYGAEVRGGTSNCQVILGDEPIASPIVEVADAEVLMNQPSADRFLPALAPDGHAFVNSSMATAEGENVTLIPATDMAFEIGDVQAANVVMFGAYVRQSQVIDRDKALAGIKAISKPKGERAVEINAEAFQAGWDFLS